MDDFYCLVDLGLKCHFYFYTGFFFRIKKVSLLEGLVDQEKRGTRIEGCYFLFFSVFYVFQRGKIP